MPKIKQYVPSLRLPKGFPIMEYDPAEGVKGVTADGGTEARIVEVLNSYLHQKNGLVDGRDDLVTYVENVFKFPMKTKTVTRGSGADAKTVAVPDETEAKYLDRFVAALVTKEFTAPGITLTGENAEQREAQAWAALQAVVDQVRTITVDGKEVKLFDLSNDIKAPERKVGVAKIPQYAQAAAKNIVSDTTPDGAKKKTTLAQRLKQWSSTFTERGLQFDDFVADAPKDATPEVKAAHEAERLNRLARAIVANEAWESAQNAKKYA